jgi:cysteinyl-tRNA synthetase
MNGRRVLWYMCGPTVYDSAHMGHARTYVTFDVVRRLLTHYFNYEVCLTMNITDIDDKIIKRSAEAGVPFTQLARTFEIEFLRDMERLGVAPPDAMTRVSEYVPEIVAYIEKIIANGYAYESNGSVYFDVQAYGKGKHAYAKLVPENAGNKAAVEEGEGVLTNDAAAAACAAAGGAASASVGLQDKRDACDFALWKRSKPGEPFWDSPWGQGRPGWHIECSTMCSEVLGHMSLAGAVNGGGSIDIHSGGIDLRFPHHDNEIAQSEAYYDHAQWVNYFIHTGHLNIEGLKMSKSLKNFIKCQDALERYGARQLRLLFLMYRYNAPMNYSEAVMENVAGTEKCFVEFFSNAKACLRGISIDAPAKWGAAELDLSAALARTKEQVRAALCDDLDTPTALLALSALVKDTNRYMAAKQQAGQTAVAQTLRAVLDYETHMFRVFGVVDPMPSHGFSAAAASADGAAGSGDKESTVAPFLDVLAAFREQVRETARAGKAGTTAPDAALKRILELCDSLRDNMLPPLGVILEDGTAAAAPAEGCAAPASTSRWKLRDPEEIRREAEAKKAAAEDKARAKAEKAAETARKEAEKREKAKIDPVTMYRSQLDKYSQFDAEGVPTHDAAGVELPKSRVKTLKKDQQQQAKLHAWLKALEAGGSGAAAPEDE